MIDVAGVGYLVSATPSALRRADGAAEVTVETYLHVREDAMQLYGFADAAERSLFVQLLGVSGIGPKVALAVVSSASPRSFSARSLSRTRRGSRRSRESARRPRSASSSSSRARSPTQVPIGSSDAPRELVARDALVELGYSVIEAEQALARVDPDLPAEERVREALRSAA